ncbi:MAG TPA: phospholipase D-like domain-containing protein [Acidimicrobiales bacterium]
MATRERPRHLLVRCSLAVSVCLLGSGVAAAGGAAAESPTPGTSNVAAVWTEPAAGYGFLVAAINSARHSVDMSIYELRDPITESALVSRARARVDVRVILDSAYSGKSVNAAAASVLSAGGVHVVWARSNQIFHAKYVVVDDRTAYIGSGNLVASEYATTRDFWVADSTSRDVDAITATFSSDFGGNPGAGVPAGGLVWSPGSTQKLVALISAARTSLLVENEEMDSATIEQALADAARRGVNVEIVLTEAPSWTSALAELAKSGDHVRVLSRARIYVHAKVICVDCSLRSGTVFIGSENFSTSSLSYNRELGVVTTSIAAIQAVRRAVTSDFAVGTTVGAPSTSPPPPQGVSGVSIISFRSSIAPGAEDSLVAHSSEPGDSCALSVQLPSGYSSESKGLGPAQANQSGNVTWQWEIGPSTRAGTAKASVSCRSGSIEQSFTII